MEISPIEILHPNDGMLTDLSENEKSVHPSPSTLVLPMPITLLRVELLFTKTSGTTRKIDLALEGLLNAESLRKPTITTPGPRGVSWSRMPPKDLRGLKHRRDLGLSDASPAWTPLIASQIDESMSTMRSIDLEEWPLPES
jgi:hypothetical protein